MKLEKVTRITVILMNIVFMFLAILLALYSFGLGGENSLPDNILGMYNNWGIGFLFIIIFAIGAWVLYQLFNTDYHDAFTVVNKNELGEVDITLDALKNLIKGIVTQQEGIDDIRTKLATTEDGVSIFLRGKVQTKTIIPRLTEELQEMVKAYIEDTSGVDVCKVRVLIDDIYDENQEEQKGE